jgi:hypothetical protein
MLKQNLHDRLAQNHQANCRRDRNKGDDAQRETERFFHALMVAGGSLVRHHRQDRGGYGNGVASQDKFGDAIGNVE